MDDGTARPSGEEQRSIWIGCRILRSKVSLPASDNPEDKQNIRMLQFALEDANI